MPCINLLQIKVDIRRLWTGFAIEEHSRVVGDFSGREAVLIKIRSAFVLMYSISSRASNFG
jgi:hypothetical protein